MLGDDSGVEWWTFVVLGVLLAVSQVLEFMSGAMGTRWFGGTKLQADRFRHLQDATRYWIESMRKDEHK